MRNRAKQRAFLKACFHGIAEAAVFIENDCQSVHYRDGVGETAFHYVVVENRLDLAKALLEWGSVIDTQTDFGSTPLMDSVELGNKEMVRWLLSCGASIDLKDEIGQTALSLAARNDRQTLFEVLIRVANNHPIDFYFDDLSAQEVFDDVTLVMRQELFQLGLTKRF